MKRVLLVAVAVSVLALALLWVRASTVLDVQDSLTTEEHRWIKMQDRPVRVGVSLHYPPYETFNLQQRYEGLSADYIRLISEKTGLEFEPVRFSNRQEVFKAIRAGQVDMVAALEMTPENREYLDFTQPYVSVPAAIITRKEFTEDLTLEKLDGMRIGVTVSDHFTKYLQERYQGDYTLVPMAGGYIGGLRSLAVGDVDALICDMALASRYIANARISNLRIAGVTSYSIELRIASLKTSPQLGSILRKGLAMILPHERKAIEEEWLSLQYRPFWVSRTFWTGLFISFVAICGAVVLILVWNRSLKRQVAQRTMALSSINQVLLGSLDCHTERDVMHRCLEVARNISDSEQAFLGQVHKDGQLTVLQAATPAEGHEWDDKDFQELHLQSERLTGLQSGEVTDFGNVGASRNLHIVAVPLQMDGARPLKAIAVGRRNVPYSNNEISLLAEVLFVFEEALQRKRAEISLHEKELQLQRVQRMEALGTMAGGIAHDFNNILGVIIANGEMIELFHLDGDKALESKTRAVLAAAYRGRELVSQILTYSRSTGEEVQPLAVSHIIKETAKFLGASLPASIRIKQEIHQPEPLVLADPTKVHQVLMNLCTNAAHAMREEGGVLRINLYAVEGESVRCALEARTYLCIEVQDTGKGMPPAEMDRVFDPFYTTKSPGEGTGLGLAVVQGIVQSLKGNVEVQSAPGQGATFRVYLPALGEEQHVHDAQLESKEISKGTGRILFVDDEKDLAESCTGFLTCLGYDVQAETNPQAALDHLKAHPQSVDLLITDYSMPNLRGDKLATAARQCRPDLPIILCTGYSHNFSQADAASLGIQEYLAKPISLKDLALTVRKYLRPHSAPSCTTEDEREVDSNGSSTDH